MNVRLPGEVFAGDGVRIVSRLIDCDRKRIHYFFHEMHHATKAYLAASGELHYSIHVDMATRRSDPFPADVQTLTRQR